MRCGGALRSRGSRHGCARRAGRTQHGQLQQRGQQCGGWSCAGCSELLFATAVAACSAGGKDPPPHPHPRRTGGDPNLSAPSEDYETSVLVRRSAAASSVEAAALCERDVDAICCGELLLRAARQTGLTAASSSCGRGGIAGCGEQLLRVARRMKLRWLRRVTLRAAWWRAAPVCSAVGGAPSAAVVRLRAARRVEQRCAELLLRAASRAELFRLRRAAGAARGRCGRVGWRTRGVIEFLLGEGRWR